MQITTSSISTGTGPSDWFTGGVYVDTITGPTPPSRVQAASVHFTPSARTAWHTHPVARRSTFLKVLVAASGAAARSRSSAPATGFSSNPARTTGTAPLPTGS